MGRADAYARLIWRPGDVYFIDRGPLGGRTWSFDPLANAPERIRHASREIDEKIVQTCTVEPLTVWRGMVAGDLLDRSTAGAIIRDEAFVAATLDRDPVELLIAGRDDAALVEIRVPSGTFAAPLGLMARGAGVRELLFARGTTVRVASVDPPARRIVADMLR